MAIPPETTETTVSTLVDLSPGTAALELGVGTGRVALPLAQAGLDVTGVDLCAGLLAELSRKGGSDLVKIIQADIADVCIDSTFDLIYSVFNSFCSLLSQEMQVRCLMNATRHLSPSGIIVLEMFAPPRVPDSALSRLALADANEESVTIQATTTDLRAQRLSLQHITFSNGSVTLLRSEYRFVNPSELDLMAELAGLRRIARWNSWNRTELTDTSSNVISVYGKAHG